MRSWSSRLLAWFAAAALLAGCATVPTTGPVRQHTLDQQQVNSGVDVAPVPPSPGSSPMLVVEGFLHAMATYQPGYLVARDYLTDAARGQWDPTSGIQVYADGFPPTEADNTVVLIAPITGQVDAQGGYQVAGGQLRHDFGLVRNADGEWRISHPPQGLLVSRYLFGTGFTAVQLHFQDRAGKVLVPELRHFPAGERALTAALTAQVAGPSAWLRPAVADSLMGLTITLISRDTAGVVDVALGGTAQALPPAQRRRVIAELVHTALGIEGVRGVRIMAGSEAWTLDSAAGPVLRVSDVAGVSPVDESAPRELFAVTGGRLQRLADTTSQAEHLPVAAALTDPASFAVRDDPAQVAAVSKDRTRLRIGGLDGSPAKTVTSGSRLMRPQYARNGELWTADNGSAIFQVSVDGRRIGTRAAGMPAGEVVAFRLSADGSRVALVVRRRSTTALGLARVVRTGDQIRVDGWRPVSLAAVVDVDEVLDVGWSSATQLLVLVTGQAGNTSVLRLDQDAAQVSDIGPSDAVDLVELSATPGRPALLRSAQGAIYRFNGEFNWALSMVHVDAVAYSQ